MSVPERYSDMKQQKRTYLNDKAIELRGRELADLYGSSELIRQLVSLGEIDFDSAVYWSYCIVSDREDETYRKANEKKLWAFYHKHVGLDDGDDWWCLFSDWYKDVYGWYPKFDKPSLWRLPHASR